MPAESFWLPGDVVKLDKGTETLFLCSADWKSSSHLCRLKYVVQPLQLSWYPSLVGWPHLNCRTDPITEEGKWGMFCVFVFRLRVCVLPYYIKGLLDVENSSNILLVSGSQFLWSTSDFTFETVLEKKKVKILPLRLMRIWSRRMSLICFTFISQKYSKLK